MDTTQRYQDRERDQADPTEPTIQLLTTAIQMSWSPDEEFRRRVQRCDYLPPDAAPVNVRNLYGVPRGR
jgi:hypothetical protein